MLAHLIHMLASSHVYYTIVRYNRGKKNTSNMAKSSRCGSERKIDGQRNGDTNETRRHFIDLLGDAVQCLPF